MIINILMIYGVLMLGGGIMGFVKVQSVMSLVMGIVSSILIFLGVWQFKQGNSSSAFLIVIPTTLVLLIVFLMRFLKTGSFMPSGMLLVLSLVVLILSVQAYFRSKTNSK